MAFAIHPPIVEEDSQCCGWEVQWGRQTKNNLDKDCSPHTQWADTG